MNIEQYDEIIKNKNNAELKNRNKLHPYKATQNWEFKSLFFTYNFTNKLTKHNRVTHPI